VSLATIGVIGIILFFVLIFMGMPIGIVMAVLGFGGICFIRGTDAGLTAIATIPFAQASKYILCAVPLFILMGYLAGKTKLSQDAFDTANKWIGHLPGGLAISTVVACAVFGAVCGDAIAAAATMSTVALPEMRRYKYSDRLSLGCIVAGGNLSFLIPPSLAFIIYAVLTEESIGKLFTAGILPGILMTALFAITIFIQCRLNPSLVAPAPRSSWKERLVSLKLVVGFAALILLVLGGIYGGIFTPTEAGAAGVFGAAVLGLINRRLTWQGISDSFRGTASMTGRIFVLIIGAMIFSRFLTATEIPLLLANSIAHLALPPYVVLAIILVVYIVIGFVVDVMSIIMIVAPMLHPLLVGIGFDPYLIGVLTVITVIMGGISPPFGIVVFAIGGVVKEVPLFTIFRGALPFLGAMFVCLVLVVAFPQIALLLPRLM
jgi:tripartite ATP-independent transporter DctM subunit